MNDRTGGAVAWSPGPDPDRRPYYPIYSPTTDRDVAVVVLSQDVTGVYVHYYNHRTRPCLASRDLCEGCDLRYPRRWKGYLACWDKSRGRLCLAQLTQEAFLRTAGLHALRGKLRGCVLRLTRAGASRNSRVNAQVKPVTWEEGLLPPAFDVKAALERIWFTEPLESQAPSQQEEDSAHE